jgi:hypothetical protein
MQEEISELKEAEKKEYQETSPSVVTERRPKKSDGGSNVLAGVALVTVGVLFLLANTIGFTLNNWWALFILIPAVGNFQRAWHIRQRNGRFTHGARGSITGGLILTFVAFTFLFSWDWGTIWPVFLIIGGLGALFGGFFD